MDATAPPATDLIVFDGQCVFCSAFARFVARWDRAGRIRFVTAQSPLGRSLYLEHGLDPDLMTTNIVIIGGHAHVKMAAFAAATGALGWPWRGFAVLGLMPRGGPIRSMTGSRGTVIGSGGRRALSPLRI